MNGGYPVYWAVMKERDPFGIKHNDDHKDFT